MRIVDTNGDGSLTPEDRVPLGSPYPDFTWGITNTFQIKNFDISFLIQGVQGIDVYNGDVYYNETLKWNKNYTLGYTLPSAAARKMKLSGVRFYVSGSNLFYIWGSGYKGINPESRLTSSQYSSSMISGYQRGGFPLTSTISAGFDINF